MPCSDCETWRRIFHDLVISILVFHQSYNYLEWSNYVSDYVDILGSRVHPMIQMLFPNNNAVFQDDSLPIHIARCVKSWFEEHEDALKHLPWPAQLPDLNIIKPLFSVLESRVRSRFPPPSSLKQLGDVLHEKWYNIPLETIQNIHDSVPRGIQAVLQTAVAELCVNKEMCICHYCFHYFDHPLYICIQ